MPIPEEIVAQRRPPTCGESPCYQDFKRVHKVPLRLRLFPGCVWNLPINMKHKRRFASEMLSQDQVKFLLHDSCNTRLSSNTKFHHILVAMQAKPRPQELQASVVACHRTTCAHITMKTMISSKCNPEGVRRKRRHVSNCGTDLQTSTADVRSKRRDDGSQPGITFGSHRAVKLFD